MLRHAMSKSQTRLKTGSWLFCGSGTGSRQCPLTGREAVPVRTRQAWPHDQNTDWFDFGSKIQKSVVCGLEVVQ